MATEPSLINESIGSEPDDNGDKEWSDCDNENNDSTHEKTPRKKKYVQLSLASYKRPSKKRKARSNSNEQSFSESDLYSELKQINENMKQVIKRDEIESIMTKSVEKIIQKIKLEIKKELKDELKTEIQKEIQREIQTEIQKEAKTIKNDSKESIGKISDKCDGLNLDIECLREKFHKQANELRQMNVALHNALKKANEALELANHNQQYSQKNNIKILNWREKRSEISASLKKDFIEILANEGVTIKSEEILAIHRVPTKKRGPRPVIMKFLTSEKRKEVITKRKNVMDSFVMVDHVTTRNLDLINTLRENENIYSAWYFNCNIHALDINGTKHIFSIGDDVDQKLRHIQSTINRDRAHQRNSYGSQ